MVYCAFSIIHLNFKIAHTLSFVIFIERSCYQDCNALQAQFKVVVVVVVVSILDSKFDLVKIFYVLYLVFRRSTFRFSTFYLMFI